MEEQVKRLGKEIVSNKENFRNPKIFVQQILDTQAKYHEIVKTACNEDRSFSRALTEALEFVINLDSRAAQFLSAYMDEMLRKGSKAGNITSQHDVEKQLDSTINVFRYLQDKDVFEDFYKQYLSSRLLNGSSASTEVEKKMISKFKAECGQQFTSRLEGMFRDIESSTALMHHFTQVFCCFSFLGVFLIFASLFECLVAKKATASA